jgi:hypothetical protein
MRRAGGAEHLPPFSFKGMKSGEALDQQQPGGAGFFPVGTF